MSELFNIEEHRVIDIVDGQYDDYPVNLLDFKVHLRPDIALDKSLVRRQSDYRPEFAYYSHDGVQYARRRFDFTLAPTGLMVTRDEYLAYYKTDGSLGTEFKIKTTTYDHTNIDDLGLAIEEQTKLRTDIVNHIKSMILGVVQTMNPTYNIHQIIAATLPFFNELTTERLDYVEIGSQDYAQAVAAVDLATTPHTYLAAPVAPGVTLKDYIILKTS